MARRPECDPLLGVGGIRRLARERAEKAVDIVNFDASESGGITEWRRAAALCALHDIRLAHHEEPQIAMHMLAAVPHGICVECFADPARDPVWDKLIANRPMPKNGIIAVPQGAGFGVELDSTEVKLWLTSPTPVTETEMRVSVADRRSMV